MCWPSIRIVIAVTSCRPLHLCSPTIKENQIRAHQSWLKSFERIVYFGEPCTEFSSISCEFIPAEDRPTIQSLCKAATQMGTWTALINADIVVSPKLKEVEQRMTEQGIRCAMSQRFDLQSGFVVDQGLDFFCATAEVWNRIHTIIPPDFRIGFGQWDLWMLNAFVAEFGRRCADISREKLIYHPKHEDRKSPNWEGKGLAHRYCLNHFWPSTILR